MIVSLFTGNQPRHLALVQQLSAIADHLYVVMECKAQIGAAPAQASATSAVMIDYFSRVRAAEREVFGTIRFTAPNVSVLALQAGELKDTEIEVLGPAMNSDHTILFGSSYVQGDLLNALMDRRAISVHMGVAPYYRGNASNFWAMYDRRPDLVGATIHQLSEGEDDGGVLFHALPAHIASDEFVFSMRAAQAAHAGLLEHLTDGTLGHMTPVKQDGGRQLRHTRAADFTDCAARSYLDAPPSVDIIADKLKKRDPSNFVRPFIF